MFNSERYVGRLMILGGIIATAALPRRADLVTNLMPVADTGLFQPFHITNTISCIESS